MWVVTLGERGTGGAGGAGGIGGGVSGAGPSAGCDENALERTAAATSPYPYIDGHAGSVVSSRSSK